MELVISTRNKVEKEVYLNGKSIDVYDFGQITNIKRNGIDLKVSELKFIPKVATERVLLKYQIDEEKYKKICSHLEKEISSILY